jgi:hypothetical protein
MNNNANTAGVTVIRMELIAAGVWILSTLKQLANGVKELKSSVAIIDDAIPLWARQYSISTMLNTCYIQYFFDNFGRIREQLSQKLSTGIDIGDCNLVTGESCTNAIQSQICRQFISRSCYKNGEWNMAHENCRGAAELLLQLNTTIVQYGVDRDIIRNLDLYFWVIIGAFLAVISVVYLAVQFPGKIDATTLSYVVSIPFLVSIDIAVYYKFALELFKHDLLVVVFIGMSLMPVLLNAWEWVFSVPPAPVAEGAQANQVPHPRAASLKSKLYGIAYALVFVINSGIVVRTRSSYLRSASMSPYGLGFIIAPPSTVINEINSAWLQGPVLDTCRNVEPASEHERTSVPERNSKEAFALFPVSLSARSSIAKETYWFSPFRGAANDCHADSADLAMHALCHMYLCGNASTDLQPAYAKYLYEARADISELLNVLRDRLQREGIDIIDPSVMNDLSELLSAGEITESPQIYQLERDIAGGLLAFSHLLLTVIL